MIGKDKKRKRYSISEKKRILKKSLEYSSKESAAKELKVSPNSLRQWIKELSFQEEILKKEAERKRKFSEIIKNSKNDFEAFLKTGLSGYMLHKLKKEIGLVRRKYSDEEKKRIAEQSLTYNTALEAAKNLGVPYNNVVAWRRNLEREYQLKKIVRKRHRKERRLLAEESKKYKSITIAASNLGVTRTSLQRYCKEFGVKTERIRSEYSPSTKIKALEALQNGSSTREVSRKLKIPIYQLKAWTEISDKKVSNFFRKKYCEI